jgi:hypothetical protein
MMAESAPVGLVPELIAGLRTMPDDLARLIRQIPSDRLRWKPEVWDGSPGETFSPPSSTSATSVTSSGRLSRAHPPPVGRDGPSLVSLDGYEMARDRRYADASWAEAIEEFRAARAQTVATVRDLTEPSSPDGHVRRIRRAHAPRPPALPAQPRPAAPRLPALAAGKMG